MEDQMMLWNSRTKWLALLALMFVAGCSTPAKPLADPRCGAPEPFSDCGPLVLHTQASQYI
jgi:hypothetical protein